jgi:hypothetical protein
MNDFLYDIGDMVCHKTNPHIMMMVTTQDSDSDGNYYTCNWVTSKGRKQKAHYYEFELKEFKTN